MSDPNLIPRVEMLEIIGDQLYVGGRFGLVDRQAPLQIANAARLNLSTQTWSTWSGVPADRIDGVPLVALAVGDQLYASGALSFVEQGGGSQLVGNVIRLDSNSGQVTGLAASGGQGVGGSVNALAVMDGDIYVGGSASHFGHVVCQSIARWDGAQWHGVGHDGGCGVDGVVRSLTVANGQLFVGGLFSAVNAGPGQLPANNVARWDPQLTTWSALGTEGGNGLLGEVRALAVYNGHLYAGGFFEQANVGKPVAVNNIARWDLAGGGGWSPVGSGGGNGLSSLVTAMQVVGLNLYVAGSFLQANVGADLPVNFITRWDGQAWHRLGTGAGFGLDRSVYALASIDNDLYVGGLFSAANQGEAVPTRRVAKWDTVNGGWSALGGGLGDSNPTGDDIVLALSVTDGELYAGGLFSSANGTPGFAADGIASWNLADQAWRSVGSGVDGDLVRALIADGQGHLYAGGQFRLMANKSAHSLSSYATRGNLVVRIEGGGSGRVVSAPAGINCPGTCQARLGWNRIALVAQPAAGSFLSSWVGADCSNPALCVFEFQQDRVVVARFEVVGGLFADGFE